MKRFTLLIALVIIFCFSTFAQTKRIAHRSHSGNHSNYSILQTNDNLGDASALIEPEIPVIRYITTDSVKIKDSLKRARKIDSLKKLKDSLAQTKLNKDTLKIKETNNEENHKEDGFSLPLMLLLIILTAAIIAIFTKKYFKK